MSVETYSIARGVVRLEYLENGRTVSRTFSAPEGGGMVCEMTRRGINFESKPTGRNLRRVGRRLRVESAEQLEGVVRAEAERYLRTFGKKSSPATV
ncbi:hypothetical protein [Thioclava sediminum]|uniref:hypothetical protein n=1 Tax=Thioclava sediminum TaxID=1915319 RepID=UPI0011BA76F4|nr:hypothetical protein [Thioclava sediminum]